MENALIRMLITVFLGGFGVHKFLEGERKMGFIYLFTFGLFGFGWIFDSIKAVLNWHSTTNNTISEQKIYDLNSIEGIEHIPTNDHSVHINGTPAYYALQREATRHKDNGNINLAIACLRKSNDISDTYERPPLLEKDYLRLVKYIRLTGNDYLASLEEKNIYLRHPEFLDRRITSTKNIKKEIKHAKDVNHDLVIFHSVKNCPDCSIYNRKIYSISGRDPYYPQIPFSLINEGVCKRHFVECTLYFPELEHYNY